MIASRSPHRRAGLSLIEVLLALAIFLMSLVVIARLVDIGTDRELEGRFQTRGARLAQSKMAEIESGAIDLTATGGTFDGDDSEWSWTAEATQQSAPNLYLVKVTVSRDLKGSTFSVVLAQMIIDPSVMGAASEATRPDPSAAATGTGTGTGTGGMTP